MWYIAQRKISAVRVVVVWVGMVESKIGIIITLIFQMNYNSYTQKPICEVFGEIPVSPLLKKRVQQRLYSLVNDIDGYTPNKNNNLDDDLNCIYHGKIIDLCCGLNNCKIDKSSKGYQNEDSTRIDKNQNDASINSLEEKLQPKINKDDFSQTKIMVDSFVSKFCDVLEDVYSSNEKENISDLVLRFKHYIDEVMEAVTSLDSKLAYLEHEFHSANEKHERDFEFLRSFISDQKKENIGNSKWENKIPVQSSKKDINKTNSEEIKFSQRRNSIFTIS
ncbi:hypothetical protein Avbf_05732 [Armadillidium vulgare]|nr:hypothetical protein Avbf_05732 [Armadillidium vulgare]